MVVSPVRDEEEAEAEAGAAGIARTATDARCATYRRATAALTAAHPYGTALAARLIHSLQFNEPPPSISAPTQRAQAPMGQILWASMTLHVVAAFHPLLPLSRRLRTTAVQPPLLPSPPCFICTPLLRLTIVRCPPLLFHHRDISHIRERKTRKLSEFKLKLNVRN